MEIANARTIILLFFWPASSYCCCCCFFYMQLCEYGAGGRAGWDSTGRSEYDAMTPLWPTSGNTARNTQCL